MNIASCFIITRYINRAQAANSRPATLLFSSRDRALKNLQGAVTHTWAG